MMSVYMCACIGAGKRTIAKVTVITVYTIQHTTTKNSTFDKIIIITQSQRVYMQSYRTVARIKDLKQTHHNYL